MTQLRSGVAGTLVLVVATLVFGCGEGPLDPREQYLGSLDPSTQPDDLSRVLHIAGTNHDGTAPPITPGSYPQILASQPRASVTASNTLYLPFSYSSSTPIRGLYLSIDGARNFWNVTFDDGGVKGTRVVPVGIPKAVLPGDFRIRYQLYDSEGRVGNEASITTSVVPAISGSGTSHTFPRVEGSDGLTVRTYTIGASAGTVTIVWETYSVPDRIDVRYGGEWVKSTGTSLDQLEAPPILDCSGAGSADGFVGRSGSFSFPIDSNRGGQVDVYVSGCLNGGTAWYFQVAYASGAGNEESPVKLPDCPCEYRLVPIGKTKDLTGKVTGEWADQTASTLSTFHPGASFDVRWIPADLKKPAGQQCTYDEHGYLITSGLGAGSYDIVSPGVSLTRHIALDVLPWSSTPCVDYQRMWPTNTGGCSRPNPRMPFDHMPAMTQFMTCPEIRDLVNELTSNPFATPTLRDYVTGRLGHTPLVETLLEDLRKVLDSVTTNENRAAVEKAYRNLSGTFSPGRLESVSAPHERWNEEGKVENAKRGSRAVPGGIQ